MCGGWGFLTGPPGQGRVLGRPGAAELAAKPGKVHVGMAGGGRHGSVGTGLQDGKPDGGSAVFKPLLASPGASWELWSVGSEHPIGHIGFAIISLPFCPGRKSIVSGYCRATSQL